MSVEETTDEFIRILYQKKKQELNNLQNEIEKLEKENITNNKNNKTCLSTIVQNFNDLEGMYFEESKETIEKTIKNILKIKKIKNKANIKGTCATNKVNIITTIGFDAKEEMFATAGISRIIKIYSVEDVLTEQSGIHCPVNRLKCKSKISCISWNPSVQTQLCSVDYDGAVLLWDVETKNCLISLEEHERRIWSIDTSNKIPSLVLTGSDDFRVKLWSLQQKSSVETINTNTNVCCVRFNQMDSSYFSFGLANNEVHCYDIRQMSRPFLIFQGHGKAVSYLSYLDRQTLLSASTDNSLREWNLADQRKNSKESMRVYKGHKNEKNFVGLSTRSDIIATGSERNKVYFYNRGISSPVMAYDFPEIEPLTGIDLPAKQETNDFISSLEWMKRAETIFCANSRGQVRILGIDQ